MHIPAEPRRGAVAVEQNPGENFSLFPQAGAGTPNHLQGRVVRAFLFVVVVDTSEEESVVPHLRVSWCVCLWVGVCVCVCVSWCVCMCVHANVCMCEFSYLFLQTAVNFTVMKFRCTDPEKQSQKNCK